MFINKIEIALNALRAQKPLILNLTNFVTMDFVANCLLALGAAPIMSNSKQELEELIKISSVLYVNIGTLDENFIELSRHALQLAKQHQKPVILDPVGVGATKLRTQTTLEFMPSVDIIRGNASEIIALGEQVYDTRGVESVHHTADATHTAIELAKQHNLTIAVSGETDFITDGRNSSRITHGSNLMQLVTGMGCAVTAVIGAYRTVVEDGFNASLIGCAYFALCGEIAAKQQSSPGNFKSAFIDQLHKADFELMRQLYHV